MQIEIGDNGFVVDAELLAQAFDLEAATVPLEMRHGTITAKCEKGVGDDNGLWRLTFFHNGKALRLTVDAGGKVVSRARFDAPRRKTAS
jgi:hypothetical protein